MATNKIAIRRDTAANWTAANPTLVAGETGHETDTGAEKLGDGTTAWTSLGYKRNVHGGALYLGGTAAANLLDYYEEGTWTVGIVTGTIVGANATYTRVGRLVHASCNVGSFSDTTTAVPVTLTGLPFPVLATGSRTGPVFSSNTGTFSASSAYATSLQEVQFYNNGLSGAAARLQHSELSAGADIFFSVTYYTT